ncbi:unnamed protein product [Pylaiella littoralis]
MQSLRPILFFTSVICSSTTGDQSSYRLRESIAPQHLPSLAAFTSAPLLQIKGGELCGRSRSQSRSSGHRRVERMETAPLMATAAGDTSESGGRVAEVETVQKDGPMLGFVGAGMMATAMINGIIASKVTDPGNIVASASRMSSLGRLAASGVRTTATNMEVASASDVIVLAVKPDIIPQVLREIEPHLKQDALVVSIAAGIPLATLERFIPGKRVARVMPNTPCLVSEGACGFSMGSHGTAEDRDMVQRLMGAVGLACEVKETLLDGVTGVSGSGPAYIFLLIEALADGGVRVGLPRAMALKLAAQTVKGAAAMVLETGEHPGVLKDQVCSPGGLTIAAIESLEKNGFRSAAMQAVITVANKSLEMRKAEERRNSTQHNT